LAFVVRTGANKPGQGGAAGARGKSGRGRGKSWAIPAMGAASARWHDMGPPAFQPTWRRPVATAQRAAIRPPGQAVDVVIGGPPCQAFARIGRAKLRATTGDPEAFLKEPRAVLHERRIAWVRALEPLVVLGENVPDALIAAKLASHLIVSL
jgi:hypothetical protein